MEERIIKKKVTEKEIEEIKDKILWISSEYERMLDINGKIVGDGKQFHCALLHERLSALIKKLNKDVVEEVYLQMVNKLNIQLQQNSHHIYKNRLENAYELEATINNR